MKRIVLILVIIFTLIVSYGQQIIGKNIEDSTEYRVALIIAQSNYKNFSKLNAVEKEIEIIKQALQKVGFEVIIAKDLTLDSLNQTMRSFVSKYGQRENSKVVIYYAGMTSFDQNPYTHEKVTYLLPIDVPTEHPNLYSMRLREFLNYGLLVKAKQVLYIFDAPVEARTWRCLPDCSSYNFYRPARLYIFLGNYDNPTPDDTFFAEAFAVAVGDRKADMNEDGKVDIYELIVFLNHIMPIKNYPRILWGSLMDYSGCFTF